MAGFYLAAFIGSSKRQSKFYLLCTENVDFCFKNQPGQSQVSKTTDDRESVPLLCVFPDLQ